MSFCNYINLIIYVNVLSLYEKLIFEFKQNKMTKIVILRLKFKISNNNSNFIQILT